jgi:hypothetical protein
MDSSSAIPRREGFGRSLEGGTPRTASSHGREPRLPSSSTTCSLSGSGRPGCRYRDIPDWHCAGSPASWIPIRHHKDFATEVPGAAARNRRAVALRVGALEGQAESASAPAAPPVSRHHDTRATSVVSYRIRRGESLGENMIEIWTTPPNNACYAGLFSLRVSGWWTWTGGVGRCVFNARRCC